MERLLTPNQGVHARTVLDYAATHTPHPQAEVRLAVLMLTVRAARAGTGNITGQDLTGWLQDGAGQVLQRLVAAGWPRLPGTVAEVPASRSEDPTAFTVPTLLPTRPRPFEFGKTTRSRISGWAQKVVGDRKIRKKKAGAATRLLALYTAAHARPDGRLGRIEDGGLYFRSGRGWRAAGGRTDSQRARSGLHRTMAQLSSGPSRRHLRAVCHWTPALCMARAVQCGAWARRQKRSQSG